MHAEWVGCIFTWHDIRKIHAMKGQQTSVNRCYKFTAAFGFFTPAFGFCNISCFYIVCSMRASCKWFYRLHRSTHDHRFSQTRSGGHQRGQLVLQEVDRYTNTSSMDALCKQGSSVMSYPSRTDCNTIRSSDLSTRTHTALCSFTARNVTSTPHLPRSH